MMMGTKLDDQAIFEVARKISSLEVRRTYLLQVCGEDRALSQRIEALLHANDASGSFLEGLPPGLATIPTGNHLPTERPGTQIGPYKLLEQIGEGGMGIVFMAQQLEPVRRRVAIKVIKPGMDTRQVIARFEAERQALAVMDHPNISRVLDAGVVGEGARDQTSGSSAPQSTNLIADACLPTSGSGRPYFVMELVRGVPITTYCDQNRLPIRERLELFASVCQAIQHAHTKGIIHRDIKPSNVLVTRQDGQPVVKVIDFGVAKSMGPQLTEKTLFTEFAQMVGTPLYMSPEQAEISSIDIDTRSDIYSLGVLLYELLTGSTPVNTDQMKKAAFDEIRRIIREDEPQRPSTRISSSATLLAIAAQRHIEPGRLSKLLRGELDWIVMTCLEKDRNRRYDTVNGLAADVRRFLNDEAVQACPPSTWYRFRKFSRRHKAVLVTACTIGLAVVLAATALTTSTLLFMRGQRLTADALKAELKAQDDLREDSYFHRITLAHHALLENNLRRAIELLNNKCPEDLRGWEWHYLKRLCRLEPVVLEHKVDANSLSFNRNGDLLASAGGDGTIYFWNSKLQPVAQIVHAHPGYVSSVTFHPRRNILASVGGDKKVKVWDVATRQQLFVRECDAIHDYGTAYAAAFSPDGRKLAAGVAGAVHVWEWENEEARPMLLRGHAEKGITVAFSPDGRRIASGSWSGGVLIWDAGTGKILHRLSKHRHPVTALAFSPDSQRLLSANFDGQLIIWDANTGRSVHTLEAHGGLVMGAAYSPDGRRIASVALDKAVRIWDAATGREVLVLRGHEGQCGCVAFSRDPNGWRLASSGKDETIRLWDAVPPAADERQEMETYQLPGHEIWSLAISPDSRKVVSGGFDAAPRVWNSGTGQLTAKFLGHTHVVFAVTWHPEGRRIASAGAERGLFTVKVWDQVTGTEVFTIPSEPRPGDPEFFAAAFSGDRKHLVTGQADGSVKVWNADTGEFIALLDDHERLVRGVVFSPDGWHLATASGDGRIKLWDATCLDQKQDARHTLQGHVPAQCLNVAFSSDGRIATAGVKGTVKIWDVHSGLELHTLQGHKGDIHTVAFSPDGRWVAAAGEDSTVKIWDSYAGGLPIRNFRGHLGLVSGLAFTSDGDRLISGSRDHSAKVWDVSQLKEKPQR